MCTIMHPESLGYFGWIRGLGCDSLGNLFVWDDGYHALWKFSDTGKLIWKVKYDTTNPYIHIGDVKGAFAVARDGHVYVGDFSEQQIIILDPKGNVDKIFKIGFRPATLTFGNDGSIFVAGFGVFYEGPYIYKYSQTGQILGQFCSRDSLSMLYDYSGNAGRLVTDRDGNIYYGFNSPYKVSKIFPQWRFIIFIYASPKHTIHESWRDLG